METSHDNTGRLVITAIILALFQENSFIIYDIIYFWHTAGVFNIDFVIIFIYIFNAGVRGRKIGTQCSAEIKKKEI